MIRNLMMTTLVVLVTLVSSSRADDLDEPPRPTVVESGPPRVTDRGYVAGSYTFLASAMDASQDSYNVEAGFRPVRRIPIVVRGLFGSGSGGDGGAQTETELTQARIGLELDGCNYIRTVCLYVGLDYGQEWSETKVLGEDGVEDTSHAFAVGRIGLDAGNEHLRFRIGLEMVQHAGGLQVALLHRFY